MIDQNGNLVLPMMPSDPAWFLGQQQPQNLEHNFSIFSAAANDHIAPDFDMMVFPAMPKLCEMIKAGGEGENMPIPSSSSSSSSAVVAAAVQSGSDLVVPGSSLSCYPSGYNARDLHVPTGYDEMEQTDTIILPSFPLLPPPPPPLSSLSPPSSFSGQSGNQLITYQS